MRIFKIPASTFADRPYCCPQCGSTSVTLFGAFTRALEEVLLDGVPVSRNLAETLDKTTSKILCGACDITWEIDPDEVFNRVYENFDLKLKLVKQEGHTIIPDNGKVM